MDSQPNTRPGRRKLSVLRIAGLLTLLLVIAVVWLYVWLQGRRHADQSHMTEVLQAVDRNDTGSAFRGCFDQLPPRADVTGFAQTLRSRYGNFRRLVQLTGWSEPQGRDMSSSTFQIVFEKATVTADVTIRSLVEEASASGDTSFLGQTRIVRIHIRDPNNGDLIFP
jgi:hypothetical protein